MYWDHKLSGRLTTGTDDIDTPDETTSIQRLSDLIREDDPGDPIRRNQTTCC